MGQTLASDLDNRDYVNPVDPDAALSIEFRMHKPILQWQSKQESYKQGRNIILRGDPTPYVRITNPGDSTSIIDVPVREEHKRRFPKQWLYFQMNEGMVDNNIQGLKVEDWDHLEGNEDLIRELKHMRFYVVEQIAAASDHQMQGFMGGAGLRVAAQKALKEQLENRFAESEKAKDKEIRELKSNNEVILESLKDMKASIATLNNEKQQRNEEIKFTKNKNK